LFNKQDNFLEGKILKQKTPQNAGFVPKTGFEPAHRLRHYHLKVACLPISPPGQERKSNGIKRLYEILESLNFI
jgi:hypothetical protein